MLNRFKILLAATLLLLSSCGAPYRIYSDVEQAIDFNQFKSYSFLDFSEGNKKTITGMELERVRVAFARELEKKGLKFDPENSDLSVQIIIYHRKAVDPYRHPAHRQYTERAVAIDMYDNHSKKHVWHGAAVGPVAYDPEKRAEKLPEVVAAIFEKYPLQAEGSGF